MDAVTWRVRTVAFAAAGVAAFGGPAVASAATVHVRTTGTDSAACGASASPCETVARGVANAASGDTVRIGAGTFPVANTIIISSKSLTIDGAGEDQTTITGNDSTAFTNNGTFRFTGQNTQQAIRDLTFERTGRNGVTQRAYAIIAQPQGTGAGASMDIRRVTFVGSAPNENPFTSNNNAGSVVLDDVTTTNVRGNSVLLGRHTGSFTLRDSHLETVQGDGGYQLYDYTWGGATWNATGKRTITGNVFDGIAGLAISGGFSGLAPAGYTGGITVAGNTFRSAANATVAIGILNGPEATSATTTPMPDVEITGNALRGKGAGDGIRIHGLVEAPEIERNSVRGYDRGIELQSLGTALDPVRPRAVSIARNQLVDNRDAGAPTGVWIEGGITGTRANDNWWGCNAGPFAAGDSGCDRIVTPSASAVDAERWILLGIRAARDTLEQDASSDVTADLAQTNAGTIVRDVFDADERFLLTATGGTLSDPTPPITADAENDLRFRSTSRLDRRVTLTQDHESVSVTWPDIPPTVTITSPADLLVTEDDTVVVRFAATPGVDGAPSCTPPDGATVPLPEGESLVTVTCVYSTGETAQASARVTRIPQTTQDESTQAPRPTPTPTPTPTDPDLPACTRDLGITDVAKVGSRSRVRGRARLKFAGQQVQLRYQPSGTRVIGRARVREDGTFSATVSRPPRPAASSDQARYSARIGSTSTRWIKLTRRMGSTTITYDARTGQLHISGSVQRPTVPGERLQVQRSDLCGAYRTVGSIRVHSDGRFSGTVAATPLAPAPIAGVRLALRVRSSNRRNANTFTTFSIVQLVPITAP